MLANFFQQQLLLVRINTGIHQSEDTCWQEPETSVKQQILAEKHAGNLVGSGFKNTGESDIVKDSNIILIIVFHFCSAGQLFAA
ncbi:hypothetical protein [Pollutibacter soli]|uniref:hypothetical protein n=1 Tax=Pollutibacter soli TaxID=3034157 RepID=UPI003013465D